MIFILRPINQPKTRRRAKTVEELTQLLEEIGQGGKVRFLQKQGVISKEGMKRLIRNPAFEGTVALGKDATQEMGYRATWSLMDGMTEEEAHQWLERLSPTGNAIVGWTAIDLPIEECMKLLQPDGENIADWQFVLTEKSEVIAVTMAMSTISAQIETPSGQTLDISLQENMAINESVSLELRTVANPAKRRPSHTKPLPAVLAFPNDPISRGAIRAMAGALRMKSTEDFAFGFELQEKEIRMAFGYSDQIDAQVWEFLCQHGAAHIKAHFGLWHHYLDQSSENLSMDFIQMELNQCCEYLGYAKHHKGGFRREQKQQALKVFDALARMAYTALVTPKNGKGTFRLQGHLWLRDVTVSWQDRYGDLFGQAREGDPDLWDPVVFNYRPGTYFTSNEYRNQYPQIAKIASGILKLTDENAVKIAGYIATHGRISRYKPLAYKAGTILEGAGVILPKRAKDHPRETRDKFERYLDQIQEVGVIQEWTWRDFEKAQEVDMDNADALAEYAKADPYPKGDWQKQIVVIKLPFARDMARLETQRQKAIEKSEKSNRKQKRAK